MACYTIHGDERVLNKDTFLVSQTDEKGIIIFANSQFCEIADYSIQELIGNPHNLVRHPDMPRAAFKDLWQTIKKGKVWTGFVKNKTRLSNQYYWVFATVFPIEKNGKKSYISCRRRAHEDEIENAIQSYKNLK